MRPSVRLARTAVALCLPLGPVVLLATPSPAGAATPTVAVTEVAPWASGNSPYAADWWELTNRGTTPVDLTGWRVDDDSNSFSLSVALAGVPSLAAGQSALFVEGTSSTAAALRSFWSVPASVPIGSYSGSGVGLSTSGDQVNVFDAGGVNQAHVVVGVSPSPAPFATFDNTAGINGTITQLSQVGVDGAYAAGSGSYAAIGSPGTATLAGTPAPTTAAATPPPSGNLAWPGGQALTAVDQAGLTTSNLSGLVYDAGSPDVLWAVDNGPSHLFKLVVDGGHWVPQTGNWAGGKDLRYPDGTGDPDSEGVTLGGTTAASGIYVSTERDNTNGGVSKLAVLRYSPDQTGSPISANAMWDLTPAIPPTGPNLGLEAISYIPDGYLTAHGLRDSSTNAPYDPASYPDHGTGLFFVGVEGSGMVYGFALDQAGTTFHLVTSFTSGFGSIMETAFDPDRGVLWAHCDNTCNDVTTTLQISPTTGTFAVAARYDAPTGMPVTMNNEGFTLTPDSECVNGLKPVYWADDSDDPEVPGGPGYSLRQGSVTCGAVSAALPELATPALAGLAGFATVGGLLAVARRRRTA